MRNLKKSLVALLLLISVIFSFASCQYIDAILNINTPKNQTDSNTNDKTNWFYIETTPDGYTGGLTNVLEFHEKYGVYWLETYEEVEEAVKLLKSHGSTIKTSIGFNYEKDLFDSKFCFVYKKVDAEPYVEGKNFFDRKIENGKFGWFGFFDDITIEELMYHNEVGDMNTAYFYTTLFYDEHFTNYEIVRSIENTEDLSFYYYDREENVSYKSDPDNVALNIFYKNEEFTCLCSFKKPISDEYHEELLKAFVVIK